MSKLIALTARRWRISIVLAIFAVRARFFLCGPGSPVVRFAEGAFDGLVIGSERHHGGNLVETLVDVGGQRSLFQRLDEGVVVGHLGDHPRPPVGHDVDEVEDLETGPMVRDAAECGHGR